MPADEREVHSAADILKAMDEIVEGHKAGIIDGSDSIARALTAFDDAACASPGDALAFVSLSRRLTQMIISDLVVGRAPDPAMVEAADRYMETALAFLRVADDRARTLIGRSNTIH